MDFELAKRLPHGTITVCFREYAEKMTVVTVASWPGAGHTAFAMTKEEARAEWKRLVGEGFKRVYRDANGSIVQGV
jgi:hypothetical protein